MNMEIFIVSHAKDFEYLLCCLGSIQKFCSGFSGVTVLVPYPDLSKLIPHIHQWKGETKISLLGFDQVPEPRSHLHHCIQKCHADQHCPGADLVLFMDSDCVWREPVTPEDYLIDKKPVLIVKSWAALSREKSGSVCWLPGTTEVLGFVPTHETMQRHPTVHWVSMFPRFRNHVSFYHQQPFDEYALSCKPDFPVGFNDFNNLNSFAQKFMEDSYHIIDVSDHPELRPRDKLIQYWSHGPIDKPQENVLDGVKRIVVPIKEITQLLS